MCSYNLEDLIYKRGTLNNNLKDLTHISHSQISANLVTNVANIAKKLQIPNFHNFTSKVNKERFFQTGNTTNMAKFLGQVIRANRTNFCVFGPDYTKSSMLSAIYKARKKVWIRACLEEGLGRGVR
jgi:xylulose-5-phosphate/fructose-6-phosphate phosphoketolase